MWNFKSSLCAVGVFLLTFVNMQMCSVMAQPWGDLLFDFCFMLLYHHVIRSCQCTNRPTGESANGKMQTATANPQTVYSLSYNHPSRMAVSLRHVLLHTKYMFVIKIQHYMRNCSFESGRIGFLGN